jgi:hypothetical protein
MNNPLTPFIYGKELEKVKRDFILAPLLIKFPRKKLAFPLDQDNGLLYKRKQ